MRWYGAQLVMYVRFKDGDQSKTPVWENTCLIRASDFSAAVDSAKELGKLGEGDADGSMRWDGRPAEWAFAGVRAVCEMLLQGSDGELSHGDEVQFEEFIVEGLGAVDALVKGRSVTAEFSDLGDPPTAEDAAEVPKD